MTTLLRGLRCQMAVLACACVGAVAAASAARFQQTPVFRGGVDVLRVDVVVLDGAGVPVPSLTAADFAVTAGGRARRVVAADFIGAGTPMRSASAARAPMSSSNQRATVARSILVVVDVEQIPAGGGRLAMKSLGAALDRLAPGDRVGLMTPSDARVALTTDRASVRRALDELVGASSRLRDREMTFGEASAIAARDRLALQAYWNRVVDQGFARPGDKTCAPPRTFDTLRDVTPECVQVAEAVVERARHDTTRVLDRLRWIAAALGAHEGPKAIVFLSGGLLNDPHTRAKLDELAAESERSRVAVHTILVEADGGLAGRSSVETSRLDRQIGLAALSEIAAAARGSVHRVQGDAGEAFAQIDRRLSGHYVLAFERRLEDRDGTRQDLDVRIARSGLTVLAGRSVTPARASSVQPAATTPSKDDVADLLRSPVAVGQVPIDVDAFVLPGTGPDGARAIVVVEIGREPPAVAAFGFQIAEQSGRVIADGLVGANRMQPAAHGRAVFVTTVAVEDGRYVARLAAVDRDGRRGSVEHTFDVPVLSRGAVEASDVIFGDRTVGDFQPSARVAGDARTLPVRLVVRDAAGAFDGISVRAIVTRARDDARIATMDLPLAVTPDRLRRFADTTLAIDRYSPGEYVVTMIVTVRGAEIARRQRMFRR